MKYRNDGNGCFLAGVAQSVGIYRITWKVENQFGSDTEDMTITIYSPDQTYTLDTRSLPDGAVGKPYYFKLSYSTTGNPDVSNARFGMRNRSEVAPGLRLDPITGEITGTPTTAGTYDVTISYGISTFDHMSGQVEMSPLIIKP